MGKEISSPRRVYLLGIIPPVSKAGLEREIEGGFGVGDGSEVAVGSGGGVEVGPQAAAATEPIIRTSTAAYMKLIFILHHPFPIFLPTRVERSPIRNLLPQESIERRFLLISEYHI
jgi:hypothetical protein